MADNRKSRRDVAGPISPQDALQMLAQLYGLSEQMQTAQPRLQQMQAETELSRSRAAAYLREAEFANQQLGLEREKLGLSQKELAQRTEAERSRQQQEAELGRTADLQTRLKAAGDLLQNLPIGSATDALINWYYNQLGIPQAPTGAQVPPPPIQGIYGILEEARKPKQQQQKPATTPLQWRYGTGTY